MSYQPPGWGPQGYPPQNFGPPMQVPPGHVLCPNCRCVGIPNVSTVGGPSGCLAIVLLCFGILPGVLYLLFASGTDYRHCSRCGVGLGVAPNSSNSLGCIIALVSIIIAMTVFSAILSAMRH